MRRKKVRHLWIRIVLGVALFLAVLFWVFVIGVKAGESGQFYNKGQNAVWIGHEWADEEKSDDEIALLVSNLVSHDISTVFVHVGPIGEDGKIEPEVYREIVNFVDKVHANDEDMKVLAWMGQLRNKINLSDENIRANIVNMCMVFTEMIGMDGVHFDIEPVWDGDDDFIKLLSETKTLFDGYGHDKVLSVALSEFMPKIFVWATSSVLNFKNYNTEKNYLNVWKYADQIVDMVYDTGIDDEKLYKLLMREQIIWVGDLAEKIHNDGRDVEFLIGIPAYEDKKEGFNPLVENVETALIGVLNGLNDIRAIDENLTGVAIYPEWEISDKEWETYDILWTK